MRWGVPVIAVLMLAITALPAGVWKAPVNDQVYTGFDPNLEYATIAGSGSVRLSKEAIDITAPPSSLASVNLATTILPKMDAAFDVEVLDNAGATEPFRVGLWSPWTKSGQFVEFGPPPQDLITAQTVVNGTNDAALLGGKVAATQELGSYQLGQAYRVGVVLDKTAGKVTTTVTGPDGTSAVASTPTAIFGNVQVSLNAFAAPGAGTSRLVIRNFSLTLPHQKAWASKADDPRATTLLVSLALAGLLLIGVAAASRLAAGVARPRFQLPNRSRVFWLVLGGAVVIYLAGNALLFQLGGQPFDMGDEKLYAYILRNYGPGQIYYLPNVFSMAWIWNGLPFIESAFPYEPVSAYLHGGIGWLGGILFGAFGPRSVDIEYLTKAVNVLFGLADAGLIYAILRQIGTSARWSLTAAGLFLFNPAVWFSVSVWGQTHVFSLFLALSAVLLAEKRHPTWAWLALAAACLTRPQMLVFGLLVGIVLLRKFTWRQNLAALSWTVVVVFLLLIPFTLTTSPSLPVDVMLHNFNVQEGGGNVASLTTVSQDSYSVWLLITYLARGASSLQRAFTPSSDLLIGPLTYQRVSEVLVLSVMLILGGSLAFKRRAIDGAGGYLPFVALGIASFVMLQTGIVATHFLLALPFLLLCRRWMDVTAYFYVAAIWTVTTFVPMYGDMGIVLSVHDYPLLAQANNQVTRFFVDLYASNRFITVAVVANICAVVWLAVLAFRRPSAAPEAC